MKILIINKLYYPYQAGGAEVSVQRLAETFVKLGHVVHVLTLGENDGQENISGVNIRRVKIKNVYWPYSNEKKSRFSKILWHAFDIYNVISYRDVARAISESVPDVIFTNNLSGFSVSAWVAALIRKIPIIHTSRDYYLIHPNSSLFKSGRNINPGSWKFFFIRAIKIIISNRVSAYVGISQYIVDLHRSVGFFKGAAQYVIFNSIKTVDRAPSFEHRGDGRIRIGYIGRLEPSKGVDILLRAVPLLDEKYEFYVAGTGAESYLLELKNTEGAARVKWLGKVISDEFYKNIDFLVVPSVWREPLGRVVLEAYSYGVPVIAANSGGMPEIVRDSLTGLIYNSSDSHELASSIERISLMDRRELRDNCLEYVKNFCDDVIASRYIKVFSAVINSAR